MNNPKSVSKWVNRTASSIVEKLCKDQMKQLGESLSTLKLGEDIAVALNQGIQEGRKLENKGIAEYIQKIIDFKTMLDRPENKRDIRILEELIKAIQSRNEGGEKK